MSTPTHKYIETVGGAPSKSITYMKILDLIGQLRDQILIMAHLHEDSSDKERLLRTGWLGMHELLERAQAQITKMAMNKLN